ncbi:hypothetical protein HC823_00440, partial [Candidatus Gracilibacteria bacterium]|nr:hypothetical protein [Candidatus Gracilibacteria bacterium]
MRIGKYKMGIVIDDQKKSKVAEIQVQPADLVQHFPSTEEDLSLFEGAEYRFKVIPEKQILEFETTGFSPRHLQKLIISQNGKFLTLNIESQEKAVPLSYSFFRENKMTEGPMKVEIFAADSRLGTLASRSMNWQKLGEESFDVIEGFPDEESDKVAVFDFPRFSHTLEPFTLAGKTLDSRVKLGAHAYLLTPNQKIRKLPILDRSEYGDFSIWVNPLDWGTHVLEIVAEDGTILFNRGMYFSKNTVLPILEWNKLEVRGNNKVAVRDWINQFRTKMGVTLLTNDPKLEEIAQTYATQMAEDDFISHTSPTGVTFEQRIKSAGLQGAYAEISVFPSISKMRSMGSKTQVLTTKMLLEINGEKWELAWLTAQKAFMSFKYLVDKRNEGYTFTVFMFSVHMILRNIRITALFLFGLAIFSFGGPAEAKAPAEVQNVKVT